MNNIKLIVLDVDGTLTDGKIYYDSCGNEMKAFNVKDGMAISQAIKNGIDVVIITGRKSKIIDRRANELGIKHVYQGVNSKIEVLEFVLDKLKITLNETIYIGDDINDYKVMTKVGYTGCPRDAAKEIKSISNIVSLKNGGDGAVREIIEEVLTNQGKWESIIDKFSGVCQ